MAMFAKIKLDDYYSSFMKLVNSTEIWCANEDDKFRIGQKCSSIAWKKLSDSQ